MTWGRSAEKRHILHGAEWIAAENFGEFRAAAPALPAVRLARLFGQRITEMI